MNKLKYIAELDHQHANILSELTESFVGLTNCRSFDLIVTLLEHLTNDTSGNIQYYIYELDWGKKWEKGYITDVDGSDIPLKTIEDLYNYIVKEA